MEEIRMFEAFAGYGSQSLALKRLGVPVKVVGISEIKKEAIRAYEHLHGEVVNYGDISKLKVEDVPDHDLFTYSFPCQDISLAGKGGSLEEGSGTRSSLLWECKKIIEGKRPKYLLLENVKNLVQQKHRKHFDNWLEYLERQGYTNYWKVLNAKDFGVRQQRERVFVVSILGGDRSFEFPQDSIPYPSKDYYFDKTVPAKYQYTEKGLACMKKYQKKELGTREVAPTLTLELAHLYGRDTCPALCEFMGEYRRITPREAFRLMGLRDEEIDRIERAGMSDTALYGLAGNSIVVDVLEGIFGQLFQTDVKEVEKELEEVSGL